MDFYGTIGPACADVKLLQQMVEAGMTGIRMNLSHGPLAAHKDWLALLRKAGVKKLLIDLQGPELRIGRLPQPLSLTAGQTVRLGAQGIPCPAALVQGVQPGQELLLDDGKLLLLLGDRLLLPAQHLLDHINLLVVKKGGNLRQGGKLYGFLPLLSADEGSL